LRITRLAEISQIHHQYGQQQILMKVEGLGKMPSKIDYQEGFRSLSSVETEAPNQTGDTQ